MKILVYVLAACAAFGQSQSELKLIPKQDDSATGLIKFQEKYGSGAHYVGLRGPDSVASSIDFTLPSALPSVNGQCLTGLTSGVWDWSTCGADRLVGDYDWSQTLGALSAPGTVTVTFTGSSCPAAATDTQYVARIYESSTPTTYSLHTQNGAGTCTRGGAGTLIFTAVGGSYTNAIITSASAGFQEAIYSVADGTHVRARAAIGSYSIYSPILTEDRAVLIECESLGAGLIPRVDNMKVIHTAAPTGIRVKNCLFTNAYAVTGATAIYADNPDGNNYGALIDGNWFSAFDKSIHAVTISGWVISKNHFLDIANSTAAIHVENVTNGDQGVGLIHGNIFTCGATCTYGILWNGPGAIQIKHNNINGYTTQIHLQPKFGTASSSGSTVTWQSGNKFRSVLAGQTIYLGSLAAVVASVDSDTQITTSTPLGTVATTDYYINITSQMQISSNNLDSGANTTKGIYWEGPVIFQNSQIENNFFSNWSGVANLEAISINSAGANFVSIRGNNIQSPQATTGTYGIRITNASTVSVTDNQIIGSKTAIAIASGAAAVTLTGNTCRFNDTACITSAASDTVLQDQITVAYADLAGLTVANSSRVYCSDCKQSTTACAGSGSGAVATRINSTWQCQDQTSGHQPWTVSGSDVYRSAGNVAIGSSPNSSTLLVKGASGAQGVLELKHGTATSSLQLYAESSFSVLGTYTSSPLIFATDSTGRWRFESSGTFRPEADDTYDIGTSSVSPNAIYSHAFSAIAASGDYMRARKLEVHMDGTGSSFFNWSFGTSNTLDLLDTASGVIQRWDRNTSDVSFDAHVWPRGTTETRNLGTTGARWLAVNTKNLNLSGNVTSNLTPSGTRDLGATGSEWNGLYTGTAVITSIVEPKVNGGAQSGDTSKRWSNTYSVDGNYSGTLSTVGLTINTGAATVGYVWTATSTGGAGSWQAASGGSSLPVVDTTGIAKGSSDATKIVRFEVDGFTSGVTNVLTPQNNSYTLAGTNISQTFSNTQTFSGTLSVSGTVGDDFIPNSDGTYTNGTTSFRWGSIATYNADFNGVLTFQSGTTFTGSILPTTNNLYALGNSSFRLSNISTVNANFSGTITAPSGSTGYTGNLTVWNSAGTASCTIPVSGGFITGAGTC